MSVFQEEWDRQKSTFQAAWDQFPQPYEEDDEFDPIVRLELINGVSGSSATRRAADIEERLGERTVRIPFLTRDRTLVTLLGGAIHALPYATWDVLGPTPVAEFGDYEDERFPAGLSCLRTVDLIRTLRTL